MSFGLSAFRTPQGRDPGRQGELLRADNELWGCIPHKEQVEVFKPVSSLPEIYHLYHPQPQGRRGEGGRGRQSPQESLRLTAPSGKKLFLASAKPSS